MFAGKMVSRWADLWLGHQGFDLAAAATAVGVHVGLWRWAGLPSLLAGVPADKRPGLYGAAAIVISLTGTLVSVSVAQYLSGRGDRVTVLKQRFSRQLGRTWKGVFLGSVLSAVLFLIAYAADVRYPAGTTRHGATIGSWLFESGAALALLRMVRLAVLFGWLVDLIVLDDIDPLQLEVPQTSDDWFAPGPARRSA